MKKHFTIKIIAGVLAVMQAGMLLAGCGRKEKPAEETETPLPYIDDTGEEEVIEMMDPYTGPNAETIYAARDLANNVNAYYSDGGRSRYTIENMNMKLSYNLLATNGGKLVTSLQNTKGASYFENSADAFVETTDGNRYYISKAKTEPSVNIYKHGFYYYSIHILGQEPERDAGEDAEQVIDIFKQSDKKDISKVRKQDDGTLSLEITNSEDPFICWSNFTHNTVKYGYISLTFKTKAAPEGELFIIAGNKDGFNAEQRKSFVINADGQYHTYLINLRDYPDYKGSIRGVRLDFNGASTGNVIIKEVKLIESDTSAPPIQADRQYHAFPDKLNSVVRFLATDRCTNIAKLVTETKISEAEVAKIVVRDASGEHDTIDGIDWKTAEYVGFDIKNAGIFGYILLDYKTSGYIEVRRENGFYVISQTYEPEDNTIKKNKDVCLGQRYYTDETHDFTGFLNAAYCERNPLTELSANCKKNAGFFRGYNTLMGVYEYYVDLSAGHFTTAYSMTPDKHYSLPIDIQGDDRDRTIYVYTVCESVGELECAAILDENSQLLPVKIEVCKNFRGDGDETIFEKGDDSYCNTFFPVAVKANQKTSLNVLHLYMNWGKVPLKQLSSIMFFAPYYHLSLGTTETNCIAPSFVHGKDLWTIPDFRPLSAPLWKDQPQHTSGGCPRIFQYTDTDGSHVPDLTTTKIDSSGPSYADVKMNYVSDDGKISASYRHLEMPQTDENRAYYEISMTVRDTVTIENFAQDFCFVSMDGRCVFYQKLGYLNENNEITVTDTNPSTEPRTFVLGKDCPYYDFHNADSKDYVNMAVIVKDSDITIGGKKFDGNFAIREYKKGGLNEVCLSLNLGKVTLKPGDTMKLTLIIMPFGSQESTDDSSVLRVRENTCLNPVKIVSDDGDVISDPLMPKVSSRDNRSVTFTISGGADNLPEVNKNYYKSCENNIAVRVYKFTALSVPQISELVNGEWVPYEIASKNGYDGYTVFADPDNSFSYSFIIDMSEGKDRTFKVTVE